MTHFTKKAALLLTAALLGQTIAPLPVVAQSIGVTSAIRNQVSMKTARDAGLRPARLKEGVSLGDDVATGKASVMQIMLRDKTVFTVGGNARMKIDKFVYDPSRNASEVAASVTKGAFRFMSGKPTRANPGQNAVRTPVASIGIRGTIFEGVVGPDALRIAGMESIAAQIGNGDPENATLVVLRGPGAATQGDERPGAIDIDANGAVTALNSPGMALLVPAMNRAPVGPFMISDAGLMALQDLLRTQPVRAARKARIDIVSNPLMDIEMPCVFQETQSTSGGSVIFSSCSD